MANIDVNTPSEDASSATTVSPTPEAAAPAPAVEAAPAPAPEPTPAPTPEPAKVSTPPAPAAPKAKGSKGNLVHYIVEGVLVVLVIGLAVWGMGQANAKKQAQTDLAAAKANPQALVQAQTDALIKKVALLMTLPSGETPTVAEVSDADAAKKQSAFFVNAQNGDKVLMYSKAGQAILYRPSTNKIILVAPLTFSK